MGQFAFMSDAEADEELAPILAELRARTGVDFARYRSTTVRRRIHNRMISVGIRTIPEYLGFLKSSTDEASLLEACSIHVHVQANALSLPSCRRAADFAGRRFSRPEFGELLLAS